MSNRQKDHEHDYKRSDSVLLSIPPKIQRECAICGHKQWKQPSDGEWRDLDAE